MYELNDTIIAVSSPTAGQRVIVRITGPDTIDILEQVFSPHTGDKAGLREGSVAVDGELKVDAKLYLFLAPHSYTGDDVAEIHVYTNPSVTEALMVNLLGKGLRMASPGEFTARSFLNGKIDLIQAEAVNEIIVSSNKFQLDAAEKLLSGRLAETTAKIRSELCDCLSLIEAGLDFSGEDIELGPHLQNIANGNPFITRDEAVERLTEIRSELEQLFSASSSYESVIDLPSVGIAGAPNAGKSSLLNELLGLPRSIVSHNRRTTRDVLTGELSLAHCRSVLFDCAGLTPAPGSQPNNVLDELAQQAAIEALQNSSVVVFCIDISKRTPFCGVPKRNKGRLGVPCSTSQNGNPTDHSEDIAIRSLIKPKSLVLVATKSDLLTEDMVTSRLAELNELFAPLETQQEASLTGFAAEFLATSVKTGTGIELLRETIDRKILDTRYGRRATSIEHQATSVALTARHRQALTSAIESVGESINELEAGNDEVTAMMLRAAYQAISSIEQPRCIGIDEQILERIFSRFCIGK